MKRGFFLFLVLFCCAPIGVAMGDSFLTAQSFPQTFSDLSFTERVQVMSDGYAPWASEYKDGVCVKNCPYGAISIEKEIDRIAAATAEAQLAASLYDQKRTAQTYQPQPQLLPKNKPSTGSTTPSGQISTTTQNTARLCSNLNPAIPVAQEIPYGLPLLGNPKITSPYGKRNLNGTAENHRAIDFAAPVGTDVYATANGVVDSVSNDARCGLGIRIKHSAGFATQYCHLSRQLVSQGQTVQAGCRIAKSGNTGRSTGPHLHYGMYRNGEPLDPTSFIYRQ